MADHLSARLGFLMPRRTTREFCLPRVGGVPPRWSCEFIYPDLHPSLPLPTHLLSGCLVSRRDARTYADDSDRRDRSLEPIERRIRAWLPPLPYQKRYVSKEDVVSEETVEELRRKLATHARLKPWSDHPRLYALLRMAGLDDELLSDPFIQGEKALAEGLSDYNIPFTDETTPPILKERDDVYHRLLQLQEAVGSSLELMQFKDGRNRKPHRVALDAPFTSLQRSLVGDGSFGTVEEVCNNSNLVFARKTMRRVDEDAASEGRSGNGCQWRLEHFENELNVLRKTGEHKHIVHFCGSYTDECHFALLFQPVAERTLQHILVKEEPLNDEEVRRLWQSFGCLASGLAWLHSKPIRHKDIKSANILITNDDEGSILFCDFGSALDAENRDNAQTEGYPHKRTRRYLSPEAARSEPRDEASDVWSLGCVFLEILTVLQGNRVAELLHFVHEMAIKGGWTQDTDCYWQVADLGALDEWMTSIRRGTDFEDATSWTAKMVCIAPLAVSF